LDTAKAGETTTRGTDTPTPWKPSHALGAISLANTVREIITQRTTASFDALVSDTFCASIRILDTVRIGLTKGTATMRLGTSVCNTQSTTISVCSTLTVMRTRGRASTGLRTLVVHTLGTIIGTLCHGCTWAVTIGPTTIGSLVTKGTIIIIAPKIDVLGRITITAAVSFVNTDTQTTTRTNSSTVLGTCAALSTDS